MEGGNFESGIDRQTSPETGDTPEGERGRERGMDGGISWNSEHGSAAIFN